MQLAFVLQAILGDGMDAASVCSWIRSVSGKKVDPRDLYASLKDGAIFLISPHEKILLDSWHCWLVGCSLSSK